MSLLATHSPPCARISACRLIGSTDGAVAVPQALFAHLPDSQKQELAPVNEMTGRRDAPSAHAYLLGHHEMSLKQAVKRFVVRYVCIFPTMPPVPSHAPGPAGLCKFVGCAGGVLGTALAVEAGEH